MPFLRTSDVARRAGVSADTVRFYERRGVLPPPARGGNGYRLYSENAVERVRLVRRALAVGFTLAELSRILRVRDRGGAPCREVRAIAQKRLDGIAEQLRHLKSMQRVLRDLISQWDARLAGTPADRQARLLDLLPERTRHAAARPLDPGARSGE